MRVQNCFSERYGTVNKTNASHSAGAEKCVCMCVGYKLCDFLQYFVNSLLRDPNIFTVVFYHILSIYVFLLARVKDIKFNTDTKYLKLYFFHDEIKSRLNLGHACYYSVQNLLSSRLI